MYLLCAVDSFAGSCLSAPATVLYLVKLGISDLKRDLEPYLSELLATSVINTFYTAL